MLKLKLLPEEEEEEEEEEECLGRLSALLWTFDGRRLWCEVEERGGNLEPFSILPFPPKWKEEEEEEEEEEYLR